MFSRVLSYIVVFVLGGVIGLMIGSTRQPPPMPLMTAPLSESVRPKSQPDQPDQTQQARDLNAEIETDSEPLSPTDSLALPKHWSRDRVQNLEGATGFLTTSWREGKLYYRFRVFPKERVSQSLEESGVSERGFTVRLYDRGRFQLAQIYIPHYRLETVEDDASTGLLANETIKMAMKDYRLAASWRVTWE